MTLDEAIKHCEEKTKELREQAGFDTDNERYRMSESEKADCLECAEEHEQLAKWLIHYKEICEIVEHWADELKKKFGYTDEWYKSRTVSHEIDNAPTVDWKFYYNHGYKQAERDLKRPHGEWIIVKDDRYGDNVKCPFCGKELAGTDLNFCCKCGAKLVGSEKMNGGAE